MRPVIVKAYASLHPADGAALDAVRAVLEDWYISDAVTLEGDLLRISHEGEYFPADEVAAALEPFLTEASDGKLDLIDLEAWTLRRFFFRHGQVAVRTASLDQALESCGTHGMPPG